MPERSNAQGLVHLDVQVIRQETAKAFQVILEGGQIWWLPKSQVSDAEDYKAGDRDCTLSIPEWLYEKKERGDEE